MKHIVFVFKSKSFKVILALALLAAAIVIALAMLLGQEAGNFVVRVSNDNFERQIRLTTDIDNKDTYSPSLYVESPKVDVKDADGNVIGQRTLVANFGDYTPGLFLFEGYRELDAYQDTLGLQYVTDDQGNCALYIYTFYVVNISTSAVSVSAKMNYSNATNGLEKCIRVMSYAKTSTTEAPYIYYLPDTPDENGEVMDYVSVGYIDGLLNPFAKYDSQVSGVVYDDQRYRLSANEGSNFMKYSVFLWIEGYDKDETDAVRQGTINFDLEFDIVA